MIESKSWQEYGKAFEFLARIINYPPDTESIREFKEIFSEPDDSQVHSDAHPAYKTIAAYFNTKKDVVMDDLLQELSVDWTRIFRGVSPGYGPPPPYEGVYREKSGVGADLIQKIYKEYMKQGLVISGDRRDRPDYLGYELDFLKFLCEQAAKAAENNHKKEVENYRKEFNRFVSEHLSTWVGDFCTQAEEHVQTPFYSAVLMLLNDTISDVAAIVISESK
jgi:TorA maturation chaperone TorD